MCCCVLSLSCLWHDTVVFNLGEWHRSLKIGALQSMFVLLLLIALMQLIQVPLVTLDQLPVHNKENPHHFLDSFPFLFRKGFYLFSIFLPLRFLHGLDVPICVVHVEVFGIWMLEFTEVVGDIIWHGDTNAS